MNHLNTLKKWSCMLGFRSLASLSIFHASDFANKGPLDISSEIKERQKLRYNRRTGTRELIEAMYFPDVRSQQIEQELDKKIQELEEKVGKYESLEIDENDYQRLQKITNSTTGIEDKSLSQDDLAKKNISNPETPEDISALISTIDNNDRLLKVYLKFHKLFRWYQISQMITKLKWNQTNIEEIKAKKIENYQKKLMNLKKINKNIEMKFKTKFLSEEELIKHDGFQFLIRFLNEKILGNKDFRYTIDILGNLMKFANISKYLTPKIFDIINTKVSQFDMQTIIKYLLLLKFYKEFHLTENSAKLLIKKVYDALLSKDFSSITAKEVKYLILHIKQIGLYFSSELSFKLEPYVLKYIKEFDANTISNVFITYIQFRKGSEQFLQFLLAEIMRRKKEISPKIKVNLFMATQGIRSKRKNLALNVNALIDYLAESILRDMKDYAFTSKELKSLLYSLIKNRIGDINLYELISVEMMKNIKAMDPKLFNSMYFYMALANIQSKNLANSCRKKIKEVLEYYQAEQEPVGLLTKTSNNKDLASNQINYHIYEKYHMKNLKSLIKLLWSYSFFMIRENDFTTIDYDLWNDLIIACNKKIEKIKHFSSLLEITTLDMELIDQINAFSLYHAKKSFELKVDELLNAKIKISKIKYPKPMTEEMLYFWLEKNYFYKKYQNTIIKNKRFNNYSVDGILDNKVEKNQTIFFVNEFANYLIDKKNKQFIERGNLAERKYFLNIKDIPYIEFNYSEFYANLYSLKDCNVSYFEKILMREKIALPEVLNLSPEEEQKLNIIWEMIKKYRSELKETNLINLEKENQMSKEIEQKFEKEIKEEQEENESDEYLGSETEDDDVDQKSK